MYGTFPKRFQTALKPFVAGKRVVDLGAGDCARASVLLDSVGAKSVLAVDLHRIPNAKASPAIQFVEAQFDDAATRHALTRERPEVAHLAWPPNSQRMVHRVTLVAILQTVPCVVYIGKNTDGTACGTHDLFEHFLRRPVLAVMPNRANTMIVYGPWHIRNRRRKPVDVEERAGLNTDYDKMYAFDGSLIDDKQELSQHRRNAFRRIDRTIRKENRPPRPPRISGDRDFVEFFNSMIRMMGL